MADQTLPVDRPAESVCPWCSTVVTAETVTCPSCGAILISGEEPDLPGVTAIDQSVIRGEKKPAIRSRNRILSWISGEYPEDTSTTGSPEALAPPDAEVQHEILRLELEAEVHNLQADADAAISEAAVEGRVVEIPEGLQPLLSTETLEEATEGLPDVAGGPDAVPVVDPEVDEAQSEDEPTGVVAPAPTAAAAAALAPVVPAPAAPAPVAEEGSSTEATPPA